MDMSRGPAPHTHPEPEPPPVPGSAGPAAPGPGGDPARLLAELGSSWTWLLGMALVSLVPGVLALVWPDETLHVLAVIVGLYLLAAGVFRFVSAFGKGHGGGFAGVLIAMLYVLAGVLCLRDPLQTIAALSLIVGAVWLVTGMLTAWAALATKDLPHRGAVLGAAALGIVAGVVVLALPTESALALTRLLGLWLLLLGLAELGVAFAWRAALRRARATAPVDAGPPGA
ncbi:HdeD family acid-resistance protein [Streptomyces sp. NPDC001595]|uniref:HdeD family acid-resistance protein n=1 Tax=Streptomyces sp. NPDC001532 TaxID=3154520 RepID=UPI003328CC6C